GHAATPDSAAAQPRADPGGQAARTVSARPDYLRHHARCRDCIWRPLGRLGRRDRDRAGLYAGRYGDGPGALDHRQDRRAGVRAANAGLHDPRAAGRGVVDALDCPRVDAHYRADLAYLLVTGCVYEDDFLRRATL